MSNSVLDNISARRSHRAYTAEALRETVVGYTTVTQQQADIQVEDTGVRYGLLPVWILTTKYQGKDYTFAMNGQTGKMVGDLPMDKTAYWLWLTGISLAGSVLAYLIGMLLQ